MSEQPRLAEGDICNVNTVNLATMGRVRALEPTATVASGQLAPPLTTPLGPRVRQTPTNFVLAAATAPPAGPSTLKRVAPESAYVSSTRFIDSPDELNKLIAANDAVMVMVDDNKSLRRDDGELWDRYAKETAGKVMCVRVSRATLDAALNVSTNPSARYFAMNNHEWHYQSPVLSKRPFCDLVDCPVIAMPKSERATPPPTLNYNAINLGTIDGPAPLSFQQGLSGDSSLIASLMAVSRATPDVIAKDLVENYDGTLTLKLPDVQTAPFDSRLDVDHDGQTFLYARQRDTWTSGAAWGPLFEKGFEALSEQGYVGGNSLADGVLSLVTGRQYSPIVVEKTSPERLLELLREANHVPVVVRSGARTALPSVHPYAVFGVETDTDGHSYVVVADPNGTRAEEFRSPSYDTDAVAPGGQRSPNDGVFRVTLDDFRRLFDTVYAPADTLRPSDSLFCHPAEDMAGRPYSADFKQRNACTK